MNRTTYRFDGTDSEQNDGHTFVSLIQRHDDRDFGCDCYFDGVGGISEVEDWQDGNGLIANGFISEEEAESVARHLILGCQVANVTAD